MSNNAAIPVIDLFAGPGGLGEGFSSFRNQNQQHGFKIKLSIEKDPFAHQTLELRSFFRQFQTEAVPVEYYSLLRQTSIPISPRIELIYAGYPAQAENAKRESWLAELGVEKPDSVHDRVSDALQDSDTWVLIGGPPCQAFSVIGRARNKGNPKYIADDDKRHFLYVEYLQVIADHEPAIFVMENVRGLLTASLSNGRIFQRILDDLRAPSIAMRREQRTIRSRKGTSGQARYKIVSLTERQLSDNTDIPDFVVRMERYGIPQSRHRVILVGIREDLGNISPELLNYCDPINTDQVLNGLPRLRSGLSKQDDSAEAWYKILQLARERTWFGNTPKAIQDELAGILDTLTLPPDGRGGEFIEYPSDIGYANEWFLDARLNGVLNHKARSHMVEDLYRYLYASCYAKVEGRSPELKDFPEELLPEHKNVSDALDGDMFSDRFRVQVASKPSTTITSHISKDGHYYIHSDPAQCRSFTVREAARIQTFPDNYFFYGPRTAQYTQVGNAVPPLLASQIARIVYKMLAQV